MGLKYPQCRAQFLATTEGQIGQQCECGRDPKEKDEKQGPFTWQSGKPGKPCEGLRTLP